MPNRLTGGQGLAGRSCHARSHLRGEHCARYRRGEMCKEVRYFCFTVDADEKRKDSIDELP